MGLVAPGLRPFLVEGVLLGGRSNTFGLRYTDGSETASLPCIFFPWPIFGWIVLRAALHSRISGSTSAITKGVHEDAWLLPVGSLGIVLLRIVTIIAMH